VAGMNIPMSQNRDGKEPHARKRQGEKNIIMGELHCKKREMTGTGGTESTIHSTKKRSSNMKNTWAGVHFIDNWGMARGEGERRTRRGCKGEITVI